MKYEVQHYTLCDGWVNCWTLDDITPLYFDTKEEAQAELTETAQNWEREVGSDFPFQDFRIVEVSNA